MRASVATLISETVTYDALKQPVTTETTTQVMCRVGPVTRNEWFEGGRSGANPNICLQMPAMVYDGQRLVQFEGERYSVYRTYISGDSAELYLEKKVGI